MEKDRLTKLIREELENKINSSDVLSSVADRIIDLLAKEPKPAMGDIVVAWNDNFSPIIGRLDYFENQTRSSVVIGNLVYEYYVLYDNRKSLEDNLNIQV
ncbi:MAG: hypothetical protein PF569_09225 [Candidatus Woesearchaeota archaeon]|jgi:hypothetical protein|nr:hypothetical protein [Candidatus Woesearchaeota archaeon]